MGKEGGVEGMRKGKGKKEGRGKERIRKGKGKGKKEGRERREKGRGKERGCCLLVGERL